jgi:hypothetical protein
MTLCSKNLISSFSTKNGHRLEFTYPQMARWNWRVTVNWGPTNREIYGKRISSNFFQTSGKNTSDGRLLRSPQDCFGTLGHFRRVQKVPDDRSLEPAASHNMNPLNEIYICHAIFPTPVLFKRTSACVVPHARTTLPPLSFAFRPPTDDFHIALLGERSKVACRYRSCHSGRFEADSQPQAESSAGAFLQLIDFLLPVTCMSCPPQDFGFYVEYGGSCIPARGV